jgi:hypothetical protein
MHVGEPEALSTEANKQPMPPSTSFVELLNNTNKLPFGAIINLETEAVPDVIAFETVPDASVTTRLDEDETAFLKPLNV